MPQLLCRRARWRRQDFLPVDMRSEPEAKHDGENVDNIVMQRLPTNCMTLQIRLAAIRMVYRRPQCAGRAWFTASSPFETQPVQARARGHSSIDMLNTCATNFVNASEAKDRVCSAASAENWRVACRTKKVISSCSCEYASVKIT